MQILFNSALSFPCVFCRQKSSFHHNPYHYFLHFVSKLLKCSLANLCFIIFIFATIFSALSGSFI